jgi:hypothetical protein
MLIDRRAANYPERGPNEDATAHHNRCHSGDCSEFRFQASFREAA